MLFFFTTLLCFGFIQSSKAVEIGRKPVFDISSTPSRNIFLDAVNLTSNEARHSLKIVNGQAAVRGQFCYQVYLQFSDGRNSWSCGGSLVSSQTILTAAHCVQGAKSAVAVLGGLDLSQYYEPGRQVIRVYSSGLQYHEKYDSNSIHNDIGIVKLPRAVTLNEYICTVKLPSCSNELTADSDNKNNFTVSGWGKTSNKKTTSKLMYVVVSGEPQDSCTTFFKTVAKYDVIESQLCTSGAGGKSTCNGDSGGPLVQTDGSGNLVQQGIVSLGLSSCELSAPSVFTDVS
ncbi:chymotrypsin-like [Macrosteles quadrilineatus]|uniref:chymotrypsin-like n=1 Tax=Macrosteles quadrilineatus TaxID=74068 RepID=UPI0023E13C91|nr:chymotrypsin-like [Macrosteles quadrilineatus]